MASATLHGAGLHLGSLIVSDLTVKLTADRSWIGCFEWRVRRDGKVAFMGDGRYTRFQPTREVRIIPEMIMENHKYVVGGYMDCGLDASLAEEEARKDAEADAEAEAEEGNEGEREGVVVDDVFKIYIRLEPGPDRVLNISNVSLHYHLRGKKLFTGMLEAFQEWSDTRPFCGYVMVQNVGNKRLREHIQGKEGWAPDEYQMMTYKRKGLCVENPSTVLIMDKKGYCII
jgi:hypothetical protein